MVEAEQLDDGIDRYLDISMRNKRRSQFRPHQRLEERANPIAQHSTIPQ